MQVDCEPTRAVIDTLNHNHPAKCQLCECTAFMLLSRLNRQLINATLKLPNGTRKGLRATAF